MAKIKVKKPDVTGRKLERAGYTYKLKNLTKEERQQQKEGIKVWDKKEQRFRIYEPPDHNYYYKQVGDVEVKIFKAGDKFYYNNSWFSHMAQLPILEARAKQNKAYDDLDKQVVDTKPIADTVNTLSEPPPFGTIYISLVGGPMDGKRVVWATTFGMYMGQFIDEVTGKTSAARYKKSEKDPFVYEFLDTIPGK